MFALSCSTLLLVEGAGVEKRQSGSLTSCGELQAELYINGTTCPQLYAFTDVIYLLTNPGSTAWNTADNRAWLADILDEFCTGVCLDYTIQYYNQNCSSPSPDFNMQQIIIYQNYYCGSRLSGIQKSRQYCLVESMDYIDSVTYLDVYIQCTTASKDFCSPMCMQELQAVQDSLGCCAVNLYNTTGTDLTAAFESFFDNCEVPLLQADQCSAALVTTAVNSLLLVVAMALLGLVL